jgi:hypothetical protein
MEASSTPGSSPSATSTLVGTQTTGIPELDAVIKAVESHDLVTLRSLVVLQTLSCSPPAGAGGPPQCKEGETAGTNVSVFRFRVCEPEWLRESEIDATFTQVFAHPFSRFAAFNQDGRRVAILEATDHPIVGGAVAVVLDSGRLVELWRVCGAGDGGSALIPSGQRDFLLPPR